MKNARNSLAGTVLIADTLLFNGALKTLARGILESTVLSLELWLMLYEYWSHMICQCCASRKTRSSSRCKTCPGICTECLGNVRQKR